MAVYMKKSPVPDSLQKGTTVRPENMGRTLGSGLAKKLNKIQILFRNAQI